MEKCYANLFFVANAYWRKFYTDENVKRESYINVWVLSLVVSHSLAVYLYAAAAAVTSWHMYLAVCIHTLCSVTHHVILFPSLSATCTLPLCTYQYQPPCTIPPPGHGCMETWWGFDRIIGQFYPTGQAVASTPHHHNGASTGIWHD